MRSAVIVVVLFIVSFVMFTGCKQSTTQPTVNQDNSNYFPNGDGTYYKFNINITDSTGTLKVGNKSTTYSGSTVFGKTTYQKQVDTVGNSGVNTTNVSYFRKPSGGVFYFLDTTGISNYIPTMYLQFLTFSTELQALNMPLSDGLTWQAFKLGLSLLNYNLIDVEASYLGKENVTLNLLSGNVVVSAAKIKYIMTLQFPNPNNILAPPAKSTFTATGWFAADIGPVKWEGNGAVLNGFSGGGIDLTDTTESVTQSLIYYNIK